MLRKLLRWMVFPSNPIAIARGRALREYKTLFPKLIERYESADKITGVDKTEVRDMVGHIVRLENALRRFD